MKHSTIFILLTVAGCFLWLWLFWRHRRKRRNPFDGCTKLPYQRRSIMTATEMQVYDTLLEALDDYMVFPQVQVSRIIETPPNAENFYWFNFISRMSYDFVVCRLDGTPIAAIEIDDATHEQADRQEADNRKNLATEAAKIAIIRWEVGATPGVRQIARIIDKIDRKAP